MLCTRMCGVYLDYESALGCMIMGVHSDHGRAFGLSECTSIVRVHLGVQQHPFDHLLNL